MRANHFTRPIIAIILLLTAVLPIAAQDNGAESPYSIVLTHHGGEYKVRFTIEGASGIKATGLGSDYAQLEGHAAPDSSVTVTMEWVECNGNERELEFKNIDVLMGNQARNGDAERSDDELQFTKVSRTYDNSLDKVVYTFNCADFQKADPSVTDSTLMVTAYSTVQLGSNVTETHLFLKLKLDGLSLHHKEDNNAKEEGGSERYIIPIVIGGVLIGGEEWLRRTLKKRKKKNGNDNENENEEGEEDDIPDMLEMELYKDFGDTLVTGDAPKRVSACIVRHPKDGGPEYVDKRLTQMIQIFADDGYTAVEEEDVINGWKCALVQAPDWETPPEEGIVQFRVASPEASYTNRIHFRIQKGKFVFGQDNITLPAMHEEAVELPFIIVGMDWKDTKVTATLTNQDGKKHSEFGKDDYNIWVRYDRNQKFWLLHIKDMWMGEEENAKYLPGDVLSYFVDLEAKNKQGFTVKTRLPLYRFYMGLAFQPENSNVGCYFEPYDPVHHIDSLCVQKLDGQEVTPAETRCLLRYYTWDEETHKIVILNPALQDDRMADTEEGQRLDRAFKVVCKDESQQERVNRLGMQLIAKTDSKGKPYYILRCRYGVLNAPNRLNAQLQLRCKVGKEECVAIRDVTLLSQPKPSFKSPADMLEWQKKQNKTLEALEQLDRDIYAAGLGDRLAPMVNYLRLHVDAFYQDNHYGFDERCVKAIFNTHHHVLEGLQAEANDHPLVACDNLEEVTWEYFKAMRTTIDDMPGWQKLFFSVATFGAFDVATGTIEVVGAMKDYVDKGGDSVFGAFYVGVKIVTLKYLQDKAMAIGTAAVKNYIKTGKADIWKETKKLYFEEINTVKTFGRKVQAADAAKAKNAQADKKADELLTKAKKNPATASEYSDEAVKYGRKRAQKNLDELQKSINELKAHPSEANLIRRNEAIMRCQQDKQTMMMLKGQSNIETIAACNNGVNFGECRKVLNNHLDSMYTATNNRVQQRLSALKPGMKPSDVKIFGATSSDKAKLLSGKSITFDRDVTYYYIDKATGKMEYFPQSITEKIYAEEFYQVARLGSSGGQSAVIKSTTQAAREFAKKMDQTVVEDVLHHAESYGIDLPKMLDKALKSQKLTNPEKVAEAVLYKGQERFYIAEKLMKAAKEAGEDALDLQASAISELIEGCRQQVKVFDLLDARDIARLGVNGASKIPNALRSGIAIMRKLAVKGTTDVKTAQSALSALGLTFEEVTKEMYRTVLAIG